MVASARNLSFVVSKLVPFEKLQHYKYVENSCISLPIMQPSKFVHYYLRGALKLDLKWILYRRQLLDFKKFGQNGCRPTVNS